MPMLMISDPASVADKDALAEQILADATFNAEEARWPKGVAPYWHKNVRRILVNMGWRAFSREVTDCGVDAANAYIFARHKELKSEA